MIAHLLVPRSHSQLATQARQVALSVADDHGAAEEKSTRQECVLPRLCPDELRITTENIIESLRVGGCARRWMERSRMRNGAL